MCIANNMIVPALIGGFVDGHWTEHYYTRMYNVHI